MLMLGEKDTALEAYGLRGRNALAHFEKTVEEHADDLIEELEQLKKEVE